ncbi:hypothetical protein C2W62_28880 [Candidatus Entotheonella serta]|nr:hypothetical protein C2W62_28880 [Candidatus Entotheonella serta]
MHSVARKRCCPLFRGPNGGAYDPYAILRHVLDHDSLFEIAPLYGRSRITAFARVNGYPVGVMINNPRFLGSSMDLAADKKVICFLQLCDTFHLPMVYFADEPGFMVGLEAQKQGILRGGAEMICATYRTRMPWITFVIRQLYGVAGQCHDRPSGMFKQRGLALGQLGLHAYRRRRHGRLPARDRNRPGPGSCSSGNRNTLAGDRFAVSHCRGVQYRGDYGPTGQPSHVV